MSLHAADVRASGPTGTLRNAAKVAEWSRREWGGARGTCQAGRKRHIQPNAADMHGFRRVAGFTMGAGRRNMAHSLTVIRQGGVREASRSSSARAPRATATAAPIMCLI